MSKETEFIIPHKDREQYFISTLKSTLQQEYDLNLISANIVAHKKTLSTKIVNFGNHFDLNVLCRPVIGTISILRNYGAVFSDSKYCTFLDADIYLSKNWL